MTKKRERELTQAEKQKIIRDNCNHAYQFVPWNQHHYGDALYKCILCGAHRLW